MGCIERKIRAKVGNFLELKEKSDKKAEIRLFELYSANNTKMLSLCKSWTFWAAIWYKIEKNTIVCLILIHHLKTPFFREIWPQKGRFSIRFSSEIGQLSSFLTSKWPRGLLYYAGNQWYVIWILFWLSFSHLVKIIFGFHNPLKLHLIYWYIIL